MSDPLPPVIDALRATFRSFQSEPDWPTNAIQWTQSVEVDPRLENFIRQMRATALTDGGADIGDRAMVEQGGEEWRLLAEEYGEPHIAYGHANALQNLWNLDVEAHSVVQAWVQHRANLAAAREAFLRVGDDLAAPPALRAQALVNLGNSYDQLGRPVEALASYERAMSIAPNFAMAMANRGLALLYLARYAGAHRPAVLTESYWQISDAIIREAEIIEYGGAGALAYFSEALTRWETAPSTRLPEPGRLSDPFGAWCQDHGLLLHPSARCIDEHRETWDVLYFDSVTEDLHAGREDGRPPDVFAAFNVLKNEFVTARFLAWLAFNETPGSEVLAQASGRTAYVDTLDYALYDLRTGLARSAFQTGANLLDKIAVTASLYLGLGREARGIGFRGWWAKDRMRDAAPVHPIVRAAIERGSDGFLGLADLAADFEDGGRYADLQALRNAATHRNVVVHDGPFAADRADFAGPVVHVMLHELEESALDQLNVARAALFYLAHGIDGVEAHRERPGRTASLPTFPYRHR